MRLQLWISIIMFCFKWSNSDERAETIDETERGKSGLWEPGPWPRESLSIPGLPSHQTSGNKSTSNNNETMKQTKHPRSLYVDRFHFQSLIKSWLAHNHTTTAIAAVVKRINYHLNRKDWLELSAVLKVLSMSEQCFNSYVKTFEKSVGNESQLVLKEANISLELELINLNDTIYGEIIPFLRWRN